MGSTMTSGSEFRTDVSTALPFGDEANCVSSTLFLPDGEPDVVLICWPGGSFDRRYWSFDAAPGYHFAEYATARGVAVLAADPLGVGGSTRPAEVDAVDFRTMAAAADGYVRQVRERFPGRRVVGVGHSLGGALTIAQQALYASYDRIASLGMTHGAKDFVTAGAGDRPDPRQMATTQARAIFQDWDAGYATAPRVPFHEIFYRPDVPPEVIAADDATATAWPRQSYVDGLLLGYSAEFAAQVECPVFLCFGENELPEQPRDDVAFYRKSKDIRLVVLENSGHCHNLAASRTILWDRLCAWSVEA